MEAVLLIDFGSTYTKVTAVDVTESRLLGTAAAYTTVETDVGEGLSAALAKLEQITGKVTYQKRLACSSAAGGLRMVAIGLVPELTAKAARLATLGAGAKLIGSYSYQLNEDDIAEIDVLKPDIVLLTGGIDGGNSEAILHNARMLSGCRTDFPVVVAGNRSCARQVAKLLEPKTSYIVENVMPKLNRLNILPAQQQIRELFLERIIRAKGLSREAALVDGILMPTP
ncbi:MAG TPA: MutL protein, partial [Clostridiales bacterium]|nr:MutL protein [Clostridiales bacterium]